MSLVVDVAVSVGDMEVQAAFDAAAGEVLVVVGPNGAGKTTLLRALAGLADRTRGRIVVGGETWLGDRVEVPAAERRVGAVFADGALFPHLSARDNVAFGLEARGVGRRKARERAERWLDHLGVADQAGRIPSQLSTGQAQRVALARALVVEPALLLLDEPLSSLDVEAVDGVRRDLAAHLAGFNGVAVVVSHDPVDAGVLASKLVVLERGMVTQQGTPAEVAAHPRSPYAARWAGLNLLPGWSDAGTVVLEAGGRLTVAGAPDGDVLVAIRPSAVTLHRSQPTGAARNVWQAPVLGVDDVGERRRVRLGGDIPVVAEVTAEGFAALQAEVGDDVWVAVKATEIDGHPA